MTTQHKERTGSGVPPYHVVLVDQFNGHLEDGYSDPFGKFETLEEAIEVAREETERGIRHCGSVKEWEGMGDAGLVYDSTHKLIWDGVKEYQRTSPTAKETDDHGT